MKCLYLLCDPVDGGAGRLTAAAELLGEGVARPKLHTVVLQTSQRRLVGAVRGPTGAALT